MLQFSHLYNIKSSGFKSILKTFSTIRNSQVWTFTVSSQSRIKTAPRVQYWTLPIEIPSVETVF